MANLISWLKFSGARLATGLPASSGFARFYVPGSDVAVDIFSDQAETEPLAQPVTLDAAGRATVYCAERADIVITTSTGAAVGSGDDIQTVDAEQVRASWNGSPSPLDVILAAISTALTTVTYTISQSAAEAPSFEFDPNVDVNVFSLTYAGTVTGATVSMPSPAPTIYAGKRYTIVFQFSGSTITPATPDYFNVVWAGGAFKEGRPELYEAIATYYALDGTADAPLTLSADFVVTTSGVLAQATPWCPVGTNPWSI